MNNKALSNCSFIKTILMLLVILGHSFAFWTDDWFTNAPLIQSSFIGELSEWIGSFHVYAFTLVSGYIFAYIVSG